MGENATLSFLTWPLMKMWQAQQTRNSGSLSMLTLLPSTHTHLQEAQKQYLGIT